LAVGAGPAEGVTAAPRIVYLSTGMNPRLDRARILLEAALREVEAELANPGCSLGKVQLGTCRDTLRGYLAEVVAGTLPPKRERPEGLGKLVIDAWPFDAPVSSAVLAAERAFRNA
jgi:hypothetical protein